MQAEEVIARLGMIPRLIVRSRFQSQRLRSSSRSDPVLLGRALEAAYLVSGSVSRSGPHIRFRLEVTRAVTRGRVWSQVFDAQSADLLDVEATIASAVTEAVAGRQKWPRFSE